MLVMKNFYLAEPILNNLLHDRLVNVHVFEVRIN